MISIAISVWLVLGLIAFLFLRSALKPDGWTKGSFIGAAIMCVFFGAVISIILGIIIIVESATWEEISDKLLSWFKEPGW
jgi:hypothetical protein